MRRARVMERDGWLCHLCGEPIDRTQTAPEPHAPTLDHVIPIARGGGHTMTNIKAAHFICNSSKSDQLEWSPAA
ncbi:HNH endonuclease [Streptomyces sp. W007]|uniref:HNH endonuclease n=1 Tax=Streptomyces sp. W007 TaxID=1055352 RepID=UPI00051747DF|nr:HNH endonuclease [Streptomyces sp. W007]